MKKKYLPIASLYLILSLFLFCEKTLAKNIKCLGVEGRSYYILIFDIIGTPLKPFTCTFSEEGKMTINMEGKAFESPSGTYVKMGNTFYGTWEATEKSDAKESASVTYSLLFLGTSFINDFYITGIIYSTITDDLNNELQQEDPQEPLSGIIPFFGVVVSITDEGGEITGKVTDSDTGDPIPMAKVVTDPGGYTTTTSLAGEYTLSYMEPGTYTVTVSALGYEEASKADIEVTEGESVTENFSLTKQAE